VASTNEDQTQFDNHKSEGKPMNKPNVRNSVAGLLLLLMTLMTSCANQVILHPIDKSDIFSVPAGSSITHQTDTWVTEKDGWFLSDTYVQEVMDAKVK
jgi:hypothetical protein